MMGKTMAVIVMTYVTLSSQREFSRLSKVVYRDLDELSFKKSFDFREFEDDDIESKKCWIQSDVIK